jgi:hypothetical protein
MATTRPALLKIHFSERTRVPAQPNAHRRHGLAGLDHAAVPRHHHVRRGRAGLPAPGAERTDDHRGLDRSEALPIPRQQIVDYWMRRQREIIVGAAASRTNDGSVWLSKTAVVDRLAAYACTGSRRVDPGRRSDLTVPAATQATGTPYAVCVPRVQYAGTVWGA